MPRPLLDVPGLAEYLGVTEATVRNMVARRQVPVVRLPGGRGGSRIRFDPRRIDAWIDRAAQDAVLPTRYRPERGKAAS